MASLDQVADYILYVAHEAGEPVTNLKLQKLVYYAQAWHLALRDEPLFDGRIEAWVHGPVCPDLYQRFKSYRWSPIDEQVESPDLLPEEIELVDKVLDVYLGFSSFDLERLTHEEDPWLEARGDLPPDANSSREVQGEAMKHYYRNRVKRRAAGQEA